MTDKTDELLEALSQFNDRSCMNYYNEIIKILDDHSLEIDFNRGGKGYFENTVLLLIENWMRYSPHQHAGGEFLNLSCWALKEQLDESKKEIAELKKELAEKVQS